MEGQKGKPMQENKKKRRGKAKLKENTELYMGAHTGELSLKNPESDTEWGMCKSTSTANVSYNCERKGERNGPRNIAKPKEEDEDVKATTIAISESEEDHHTKEKKKMKFRCNSKVEMEK